MKISELEARLKELREEHGDGNIYATCHKNNMFYSPTAEWRDLEMYEGTPLKAALICPVDYGTVEGRIK